MKCEDCGDKVTSDCWCQGANDQNLITKSDGGPSSYYDMPFQEWMTLNDQMEYLAQNK